MTPLQTYVINLDRSKDRLEAIAQQLQALGLSFSRIPAVDGRKATPEQRAFLDETSYQKKHGKTSLPGELGCYLSHVNAIQTFLLSDASFALILEDDAIFAEGFVDAFHELMRHPNKWDMVKLSGVHSGTPVPVHTLNSTHALSVMFSKCTCSSAYLINRTAAQAYSEKLLPMTLPYDHEFDLGWKYQIKIRAVTPFPVIHNETVATTIVSGSVPNVKFRGRKRWTTYWYRLRTEISRLIYAVENYLSFRL
jgi:glycosyl transferase family 25